MNKKTFTERASRKFNGEFDYTLSDYTNSQTKVSIRCNKHNHIFEQKPSLHLKGMLVCPYCVIQRTKDRFIKKANTTYGDRFDYSLVVYTDAITKVSIKCNKHTIVFEQTPDLHLDGRVGCPQCKKENKIKKRCKQPYNDDTWLATQTENGKTPIQIARELGVSEVLVYRRLREFDIALTNKSNLEHEIYQFVLNSIPTTKIVCNTRSVIAPYEVDIFIPDFRLAIEVNGDYFHCSLHDRMTPSYHSTKYERCNNQQVQLIQIWEHQWNRHNDICKSLILHQLQKTPTVVYGRKTTVVELTPSDTKTFLDENHLQGAVHSKYRYGLTSNGQIVAVMTFGQSRFHSKPTVELLRFAVKNYHHVPGGAAKLFQHAVKVNNFDEVISYSQRNISKGNLYIKLGFEHRHTSKPGYQYLNIRNNTIHSRQQFQKHKLSSKLDVFDDSLTEEVNMINNKYYRLYDSGNDLWWWKSAEINKQEKNDF